MKKKKKREKPEWLKIAIDIWHTKQYRSAIKLALYFIFVAGVLIFLQFNYQSASQEVPLTPLEKYEQSDNYQYRYTVTENNVSNIVEGSRYQQKEKFKINQLPNNYLLEKNQVYQMLPTGNQPINPITSFSMEKIKPDDIGKMLEKAKEISKTEYTTGEEETTYQISVNDFSLIYSGNTLSNNDPITIKIMIKEDMVATVLFDLTNYRKIYVPTSTQYELKLEYFNYNQVEAF